MRYQYVLSVYISLKQKRINVVRELTQRLRRETIELTLTNVFVHNKSG